MSMLSYPDNKLYVNGHQEMAMHEFLKEAVYILRRANDSIEENQPKSDMDRLSQIRSLTNDEIAASHHEDQITDGNHVAWKLNLTPTTMTLDTNIQSVSGLEEVLDQLRLNIHPALKTSQEKYPALSSDHHDMHHFTHVIADCLCLSSVIVIPRADVFRQFSTASLMRHCVQFFISCGGAMSLDTGQLISDMELVLTYPNAMKDHPVKTLLLLSICSAMVRHVMIHERGNSNVATALMYSYHLQARLLLQDLFDIPHVYVIQSLLLLSLFPHTSIHTFSQSRTWSPLLCIAVRLTLAMNLHLLDQRRDDDTERKEKLRRLAWAVLCADHFADRNQSCQSTGTIHVTDWHVDFPRLLTDESSPRQVEYFSQYCRIVMIRKLHLFTSAYMVVQNSPQALRDAMDESLFKAYFNTPDSLDLEADSLSGKKKVWAEEDLEPLLILKLHCNTLIEAHVPFLPQRYLTTLEKEQTIHRSSLLDFYQRVVQATPKSAFITEFPRFFSTSALPLSSMTKHGQNEDTYRELHCVLGCVTAANTYTLLLETLFIVDPVMCHYNPVYGALVTAHIYYMIHSNCHDPDISMLCKINLARTVRILHQARTVYRDPAILYMEQMISRWSFTSPIREPSHVYQEQTFNIIQAVRTKIKNNEGEQGVS